MTQQFSEGDKVTVREGARSLQGIRPDPNEVRTVMGADPEEEYDVLLSESVHGYMGRWFKSEDLIPRIAPLATDSSVAAADDGSPSSIDPSKVKPGDTATLERDRGRLPDQVVAARSMTSGGCSTLILEGGIEVKVTGPDAWTITAHQPAPEPEPEPAPGFYTVHPYDSPETNWTGFVDSEGTFYGEEDGFFRQAFKGDYTVDSRLVVIDPEEDVDRLSNIIREVDGNHDLGAGALAEAILERLAK